MLLVNQIRKIYDRLYEMHLANRLHIERFSIISSNCIGGVIYHRLHKYFLSPTINLYIKNDDFIKFATNLEYYISLPLVFEDTEYAFPVARLDDIYIYFNHYHSADEARNKWEERKKRIDYSNLYFIAYERDGVTEDDIRLLGKLNCANLVVFSECSHPDIPYVITYKPSKAGFNGSMSMNRSRLLRKWSFENNFDYVRWLNERSQETRLNT